MSDLPYGFGHQEEKRDQKPQQQDLPDEYLLPEERKNLQRQMGFPEDYPKAMKSWLVEYLGVNPPDLHVKQLRGFAGFQPRVASGSDTSATGNSSFTDLGGPELTDLEKGNYLLLFGFNSSNPSNTADPGIGIAAPSVNGAAASDSDGALCEGEFQSAVFYKLASLDQPNNSIKLMYRMQGGTGNRDFNRPFLIALKISG